MNKSEMYEKKVRFVRKEINRRVLDNMPDRRRFYEKPADVRRLVERARRDIGYSAKTVDYDILTALKKACEVSRGT